MDICGNICRDKASDAYVLKCLLCAKEVEIFLWQQFIEHFQTLHISTDEQCTDPLFEVDIGELKEESDRSETFEEFLSLDAPIKDEPFNPTTVSSSRPRKSISYMEDEAESDKVSDAEYVEKLDPTTKFNLTLYRRNPRTKIFIEIYKRLPCLWNPHNINYGSETERKEAIQILINDMKRLSNVDLTEQSANASIKKLHSQYFSVVELKKKTDKKISCIVLEHFEKCSFLQNIMDIKERDSESENDNDNENESEKSKTIVLTKVNAITTSFMETYKNFPQLYDRNHSDYTNITARKQACEDISENLRKENILLTDEEINKIIKSLRHWYSKMSERAKNDISNISPAQQFYLQKLSFLPAKSTQQKLPCDKCGKIYLSENTLKVHLYKDHNIGELPFKCPDCERSFEQKYQLAVHQQRVHIGKVHQCNFCERSFSIYSVLQLHIRTHTGQKPYVCELCGKAFRLKAQLGFHVNAVHTKIRAFKCTMCPKDFLKKCHLTDHMKSHLNIRDKKCETCGKGFTNCHSLIRHRQIHAEVKKFACKLCDAKFHQFVGLNSHMKRTHKIVKNKSE